MAARRRQLGFDLDFAAFVLGRVFHFNQREPPVVRFGRNEGGKRGVLLPSPGKVIGDKIALKCPGTFQARLALEMDNQNVNLLPARIGVGGEALEMIDSRFVGVLDVLLCPDLGLGLVDAIQKIPKQTPETILVKRFGEGFSDKILGLCAIHVKSVSFGFFALW